MAIYKTPEDLAGAVMQELRPQQQHFPSKAVLDELFAILYYASLRTEESQPIHCYIVYLNPKNRDPDPPEFPAVDRWNCIELAHRIPLTVQSLVKIAKASDPRTSSFAIYHNTRGKLFIWGLVDQGNRYHEYVNFNTSRGPDRPGLFQAAIIGIGHVATYRAYERIAELHVDKVVTESHDVLRFGPVSRILHVGVNNYIERLRDTVGIDRRRELDRWTASLQDDWTATICRLLLRIKGFRHGGALLITPDADFEGLNVKYPLSYNRLSEALVHSGTHWLKYIIAAEKISTLLESEESEEGVIPNNLYLDETVADIDFQESESELDGAIWFVSLLSRVDGLVLMTPDLEVRGFGVEILQDRPPLRLFRSTTATATTRSLRQAEYQHFGTRHRSMMRYCSSIPGSVGFVVSQDGEVRVMTRVGNELVFWDSIRLQLDEFVRQRSRVQTQRSRSRSSYDS
jgi:hypothetical protein